MDAPIAVGFEDTVEQRAQDQAGQMPCWQERRFVGRSLAFAASQEKSLRQRAVRAVAEINALHERKQGKKLLPDAAAAQQAAAAIIATHRVAALVHVEVQTETHEHLKRRDGARPATTVRSERVCVSATSDEAALEQAVRRLGWRVYATHHTAEDLRLEQSVAAYRSEYLNVAGKSCPVPKNTEKQRFPRSHGFRDPKVVRLGRTHLPVAYPRSDVTSLTYPSPQRFRSTGWLTPLYHTSRLWQRRLDPASAKR